MIPKKGAVILVAIALVLAVTAISLNVLGSDEIQTKSQTSTPDNGGGQIGIAIEPSNVEDKGADETTP